jgi:hypothetical protein
MSFFMAVVPSSSTAMDFNDPFFLHPHESPASILIPFTFSGDNYHQWSQAFLRTFRIKNKVSFVDGSLKRPTKSDAKYLA